MNNLQFLTAVRSVVEEGWTTKAFARDVNGKPVISGSPEAVSHCIVGAARAVAGSSGHFRLHNIMWREVYNISEWNDWPGRTKSEVLAMLDKFIEKEQG